jgi:hypothetical protein
LKESFARRNAENPADIPISAGSYNVLLIVRTIIPTHAINSLILSCDHICAKIILKGASLMHIIKVKTFIMALVQRHGRIYFERYYALDKDA